MVVAYPFASAVGTYNEQNGKTRKPIFSFNRLMIIYSCSSSQSLRRNMQLDEHPIFFF